MTPWRRSQTFGWQLMQRHPAARFLVSKSHALPRSHCQAAPPALVCRRFSSDATKASTSTGPDALRALAQRLLDDDVLAERLAGEPSAAALLGAAKGVPQESGPDEAEEASSAVVQPPSLWQVRMYSMHNLIPFIGFGFFDNFVMILTGDFMDAKIGVMFGFTTMTAAAIGNTVSDVVGLWVSGFVEATAAALGMPDHKLTTVQTNTTKMRIVKNCSMVVGLVIGCILGMFPLAYPSEWRLWESREQKETAVMRQGEELV